MPLIEKSPGVLEALDTRPFEMGPDEPRVVLPPSPPASASPSPDRSLTRTVKEAVKAGTLDDAIDAIWREAVLLLTDREARAASGFLPDLDFPASPKPAKDASGKVREAVGFLTDPFAR